MPMRIFSSRSLSPALFLSWLLDFSPALVLLFILLLFLVGQFGDDELLLVFQEGEGVLAVDQLRGEQGTDLVVEIVLHDLLIDLAHVVDVQHLDVLGAQQLPERGPGALGDGVDGLDLSADGRDLSGGIQAGLVVQLIRLQDALVVQRADRTMKNSSRLEK